MCILPAVVSLISGICKSGKRGTSASGIHVGSWCVPPECRDVPMVRSEVAFVDALAVFGGCRGVPTKIFETNDLYFQSVLGCTNGGL